MNCTLCVHCGNIQICHDYALSIMHFALIYLFLQNNVFNIVDFFGDFVVEFF